MTEETPDSQLKAAALIADEARRAPDKPGVYRMYGEDGSCLYVGKAKSLKKRIVQYAQGRFHTQRIGLMVAQTRSMELVVTASETEALLLESNFIKKLKPRFNVVLRDDKSFAELMIRRDHRAPQVRKHRGAHTTPGDYFGPFASTWAVNRTLNTLQKAFLLRSCSDSVYETRTRPCMLHQIKRCSAPCTGLISLEDYGELVTEAEQFLRGKSRAVIGRLSKEMQAASDEMDFEQAARVRDRIRALSAISMENSVSADSVAEGDVFALHSDGGQACVQVFFYRAGQNWGGRAYFPRVDKTDTDPEILAAFLGQFYEDKPIPRLILSNVRPHELELLEEAFSMKADRKIEIVRPMRGERDAARQLLPKISPVPQAAALPLAFVVGALYLLWLARRIYRLRSERSQYNQEIILLGLVFLIAVGVAALGLFQHVLAEKRFFSLYASAIGLAFLLVQITLGLRPQLVTQISESAQISQTTYSNSTLGNVDCNAALARLASLMQTEHLYADQELSLANLAQRLELSSHQLSELINAQLGKGFSRYLREQRSAAARHMLCAEPSASVLSVGLSVGFSSQSNFYEAFREIEGMTPGQYRKLHLQRGATGGKPA